MSLQKTPVPVLDLKEVDIGERRDALRGFLWKNSEHFRHVIVRDDEGVSNFVSTAFADREKVIDSLMVHRELAPDDAEIHVTDPLNIKQTFLELTTYTCPHGNEYKLYDHMLQDMGWVRNGRGNYWFTVGDGTSKTLFVAHLDTADRGKPKVVEHDLDEEGFCRSKGNTVLGADDKAGMTVLLYMIAKKVPGDYLLVIGEEVGCIGSGEEALHIPIGKYDRAVAFDRAGTSDIITHQMRNRTASREFARALAKELRRTSKGVLQLQPCDRGMYTDTNEFVEKIPECTNISIGYEMQHTWFETQDLSFLATMANAACDVNWETLPTKNPVRRRATVRTDAVADDDTDYDFLWDTTTLEIGNKSMWELWADIDSGNLTMDDVRTWVIYNPAKAGAIIKFMIERDSTAALDILTEVEDNT